VLLKEAIDALNIRAAGVYVDATFGQGGHSRAILKKLGSSGKLIALDRDSQTQHMAQQIAERNFCFAQASFSGLAEVLKSAGVDKVAGILLDLGVSSAQLSETQRGFSFQNDGPLDMRMDQGSGEPASKWLARASERQLEKVIRDYGEERFAKQIARAIVALRTQQPLTTTAQLAALVAKTIKKHEPGQNPATRTFQAIRIHVNQELEELSLVLPQCVEALQPGGRLVVISFHSLEDRIVKHFIRAGGRGESPPARVPIRARDLLPPRLVKVGRALRPADAEIAVNPRARSAVMRIAQRTAHP
jgi:16S rRNA (cytosine1402-N4)-methyltransferase